jgi:cell fate regulator YaaT (PSP1 superfamily)
MTLALIRYGTIPEVSRFTCGSVAGLKRGAPVVVETHRGLQVGTFLERVVPVPAADRDPAEPTPTASNPILRTASADDLAKASGLQQEAAAAFAEWTGRIAGWNLELELIDLEWTLDRGKLILYVLNERGPDCTKLALQAAAAGLGPIEVQPVTAEGLVTQPDSMGGGCGSCGCG